MRPAGEYYILLFFAMSMLGWLIEVVGKYIEFGRFINRGFLIGPYCPIYGVGSILIVLLLERYADSPLAVFGLTILICGTLEYVTSYGMEKLFHARWWDYSHRRFNIDGRVCAGTLIPFGLLGLLLVYLIKPALFSLFEGIPQGVLDGVCIALCLLFAADAVVSAAVLGRIRKSANTTGGDDTETLTKAVRDTLSRQSALMRRTLRAFPYARIYNNRLLEQFRRMKQALRTEGELAKQKLRDEYNRRERKLRAELNELKQQMHERRKTK